MIISKKELEDENLYEEAKSIFTDVELFPAKKTVIGLYKLLKKAFKADVLEPNSISIFTFYYILGYFDKSYIDVIYYRYISNLSFVECGKILNCSRETVRTKEAEAIRLTYDYTKNLFNINKADRIKREALFKKCIKSNSSCNDDILIRDLQLSTRTYKTLLKANIRTASQLCLLTNDKLNSIDGITRKGIREISIVKSKLLESI